MYSGLRSKVQLALPTVLAIAIFFVEQKLSYIFHLKIITIIRGLAASGIRTPSHDATEKP